MNEFDIVFSLGPCCRPAYYLQLCGLRTFAYPLDWQGCSIESALHLYETNFEDFFIQYKDLSKLKKDCTLEGLRYVVDVKNNIKSMHHIKNNIPLDEAVSEFKEIMIKRYNRLNGNLNNASSILIVSNYNKKLSTLSEFLIRFSKIYKNKKITLINIHSRKNGKNRYVHKINENLSIIEYFFNDINKDGEDPKYNKNFWLGNEEKWIEIINSYSFSKQPNIVL